MNSLTKFQGFLILRLLPLLLPESAGHGDGVDGHLDASLAAASLRHVRDALPVLAPFPFPVIPSGFVRSVHACALFGGAGRSVGNVAATCGDVAISADDALSFSDGDVTSAAARTIPGATNAATGWGALSSTVRHDSVSAVTFIMGLCEGAAVVAGDASVVPGVVSMAAGGGFQGSVAMEGGGTPAAVEDFGSVLCLPFQLIVMMVHRL